MSYRALIAGALAAGLACAAAPGALAQDKDNTVNNSQATWAETRARLNGDIKSVTEDVTMTAAAIGNSMSASLGGASLLNNTQTNTGAVSAALSVNAQDAFGSLTATAAAIGNSASVVIDELAGVNPLNRGSQVNNNQSYYGGEDSVLAELSLSGGNISSGNPDLGIAATAAAIANSLSVDVKGNLEGNNLQTASSDVRSYLSVDMNDVWGASNLTSAAIANSASFNVSEAGLVSINNTQIAGYDPTAVSSIRLNDITGDITSTTASISNTLSVSTLPSQALLTVNSSQENGAGSNAIADIMLGDVVGSVTATAAAIGNSVSITNLP